MKHAQLADLLRPTDLDGIIGQDHLFGERGVFSDRNKLPIVVHVHNRLNFKN